MSGLILAAMLTIAAAEDKGPSWPVMAGIEAYERGDYETALAWLKPAVYDIAASDSEIDWIDPWAGAYLARMIQRGEGVPQDAALACAILEITFRKPGSRLPFTRVIGGDPCDAALPARQAEVQALTGGCFLDGITRTEFRLDAQTVVVVDRTGFHIDTGTDVADIPLPVPTCYSTWLRVMHRPITIGDGSTTRHFLQFTGWRSAKKDGQVVRALQWTLVEIAGTKVKPVAAKQFGALVNVPYPSTDAAAEELLGLLAVEGAPDGSVQWIMRKELRAADDEPARWVECDRRGMIR